MIAFVEEKTEFDSINIVLNKIIYSEKLRQSDGEIKFREDYYFVLFSDFDVIRTELFYYNIIKFLGGKKCYLYTISPDAENYYYHFFNKYSLIKFDDKSSVSDVLRLLHEPPQSSRADAIIDISDIVAIFPEDASWAMVFDREKEQGILASGNEYILNSMYDLFSI